MLAVINIHSCFTWLNASQKENTNLGEFGKSALNTISTQRDLVLWLWRAHNEVQVYSPFTFFQPFPALILRGDGNGRYIFNMQVSFWINFVEKYLLYVTSNCLSKLIRLSIALS